MGEMPEEWKNCAVMHIYKKDDKEGVKTIEELSYLKHVTSKILNFQ
jgi:hypothetical protein